MGARRGHRRLRAHDRRWCFGFRRGIGRRRRRRRWRPEPAARHELGAIVRPCDAGQGGAGNQPRRHRNHQNPSCTCHHRYRTKTAFSPAIRTQIRQKREDRQDANRRSLREAAVTVFRTVLPEQNVPPDLIAARDATPPRCAAPRPCRNSGDRWHAGFRRSSPGIPPAAAASAPAHAPAAARD